MAQAIPILHPPAHMAPVITLAKFYARKRVIHDFQAAGIRFRELGAAQINLAACAYLSNGPGLIARATETLAEWAERDRIRKEMRRQRRAKLRRSPDFIGLLVCKTHVQNGGAEMIIGYGRVSTDGQSLESQLASLKAAGAEKVFAEKISFAKTDRRALASAIKSLGPGDCLIVTMLDRLARSTRDLLNVLDAVAKAGAGFRSLAE